MKIIDLEKETINILQKDNWEVLPNAYYTDPSTKKPREKDIVATSCQFSNDNILRYNARLFIECKNFPQKTELYSISTNSNIIEKPLLNFSVPFVNFSEIERFKKLHFYNHQISYGAKDSKDFIHTAINQNLQALDAFRQKSCEKAIYYLIVVCQGELNCIDQTTNLTINNDEALIEINALDDVFNLPNKKCYIEIVSISKFGNLLKKIRDDIQEINNYVCFNHRMEKNRIKQKSTKIMNDSCK